MLSGKHVVPPGDVGWFIVLSADKPQAKNRIKTAHKALDDLEIPHRSTTEEITLNDRPIGMKAIAATLEAVVSDTCIGTLCDEMARWRDKEHAGANPAKEILTSLKPSMATMPRAMGWYVSAPWSTLDEHHKMVEAGTDESQEVFVGATWEMNPTITEQDTYALERDDESRLREYGAVPMSSDETKFFAAAFIEAARVPRFWHSIGLRTAGGDFAFRRNSSTMVVLDRNGERLKLLASEERIPGVRPLVPSVTIRDLVGIAAQHGCVGVACDLHYIESVREATDALQLDLIDFPSDGDSIAQAYVRARVLLADGMLDLSGAPDALIEQLKETTSQPTINGMTIKNPVKDGKHGDNVSALICAIWASEHNQEMGDESVTGQRRFPRGGESEENGELAERWTN
jgi:hypothetical protein